MNITFPYRGIGAMAVPDENLLGVFGLAKTAAPSPPEDLVRRSVRGPIGAPPLRELARGKSRVLIVCDDVSRPTPAWKVIPTVLGELAEGGVPDDSIEFLMALGTHRPMTDDEIRAKIGAGVFDRFRAHNHAYDDASMLASMGRTEHGVEVWVNRKVVEADCVISIGRIMPIDICGFTGGGKMLIPGCCGESTLDEMHWLRVDMADPDVVGQCENPIRASIDEMARKAGLDFIVNIVMDAENNIIDCVSGDLVDAHREGCRRAKAYHEVRIPARPEIVVVDGNPFDMEFWQVNKAVDTAGLVVADGGVVVCVSPCYEGFSQTYAKLILQYGYRPIDEIKALVDSGAVRPRVVGVHMVQVSKVAIERARVILVTKGITAQDVVCTGLLYAPDPQQALDQAFEMVGTDARVAVLRNASEMLPVVDDGEN